MGLVHSSLLPEDSALYWEIARYGFPPICWARNAYSYPSKQVDEQAIELLAPRVKFLFESLCAPIPLGDVAEEERERKLERRACNLWDWGLSLTSG